MKITKERLKQLIKEELEREVTPPQHIEVQPGSAEVYIGGLGTMTQTGGAPIFIEEKEGRWYLYVWSDITKEDPTHTIDLSGASESLVGG